MDFTLNIYQNLLKALQTQGFSFLSFSDFIFNSSQRIVVLRHDVDSLPLNSFEFSRIQAEMGIRGSYYFRVVPGSWDEAVIKEIAAMGHEVGYHYEDLSFASAKLKAEGRGQRAEGEEVRSKKYGVNSSERDEELERKIVEFGIESFKTNLNRLRKIVPVKTICMHGSPLSRWDSRLLWKYYDYRDFGITGEPYFDVDFDEVMYLTDTGRRWDGESVSVRDKVQGAGYRVQGENPFHDWKVKPFKYRDIHSASNKERETRNFDKPTPNPPPKRGRLSQEGNLLGQPETMSSESESIYPAPSTQYPVPFPKCHSTSDIIRAAEAGRLPNKIMMTFHPQRWTDKPGPWVKELVWQNVKNVGKWVLVKRR